jgi:hypothetical protein
MIRRSFDATIISGNTVTVGATVAYNPEDPYAVHFRFTVENDVIDWCFDRELLRAGVSDVSGIGDVRVWPGSEPTVPVLYLSLTSPDGSAVLQLPQSTVVNFLTATYELVPSGSEEEIILAAIDNYLGSI